MADFSSDSMTDRITRLNAALQGRYRIEREIGEGGMATVYLAEDLRHERKVALKVLKPELAAVVGAERFLAEIKTTANLQHPHILALHDSGEADGFLYFVMPYVEGDTLRDKIDREKQLSIDDALEITKKVASALDYAHEHGVVHRDIKPGNILLSERGEPTVADFGIALAVAQAGGGRVTETGLSIGTPHYMSPEQATGDRDVDPRADVYALGCVLYEMLTGDPPYGGSTAQAVLAKILTDPAPTPTKVRVSIPPNVDAAIRKALEKLPADRFRTAQEFTNALGDSGFRYGEPAAATGSVPRSLWNPLSMATAGLAVVLAVALVASLMTDSRDAGPQPTRRFRLDLPPDRGFSVATVQPLSLTPDGHAVIFSLIDRQVQAAIAQNQLFIRRFDSLEPIPIPGTENVGSFFLSPDGLWVGFNAQDETLKKVPLAGGPATTVVETPGSIGGFRGADWGDNGTIVFGVPGFAGLMEVPDVGGTPERVTFPDTTRTESHRDPKVLPGGETVLFVVRRPDEPDQIAVGSLGSEQYAVLTTGANPAYVGGGLLIFYRGNALWAASFDPVDLTLLGEPFPAIDQAIGPFSLSQDGTLVYLPAGGESDLRTLVLVDRAGREQSLGIESERYSYPRFSPDGGRLAVVISETAGAAAPADLWVFDLERVVRSRLTFEGTNRYFPVWAPTGDRLAVSDGVTAPNTIQSIRADGNGGITPLLERDGLQYPTSWSGDGSVIAYHETNPETGRDLWLLPENGDPEPFLVTPFQEHAATFSPDGRWIAFVSNESGQDEIYVRPHPGPGPRVTVSTDGGREPVWSPDGSELFYRTQDQLMVVPVALGQTFEAGTPRPLFPDGYLRDDAGAFGTPNYDVRPDGRDFVMLSGGFGGVLGPQVIVVQNFFEELRQTVPD